jgi:protein-disulfide isomerase
MSSFRTPGQRPYPRSKAEAENLALAERRDRRRRRVTGYTVAVVCGIAVAIAVSRTHEHPGGLQRGAALRRTESQVTALLNGIPQRGTVLGDPRAAVTLTYFGDLECPICQQFTLSGGFPELVARDVRAGTVKVVYRSECTATCGGPGPQVFADQQVAAYAAGLQDRFWNYAELFYREQGSEGSSYANAHFLDALAGQVTGLNLTAWRAARADPALAAQVRADGTAAVKLAPNGTPTLIATGAKGSATAPAGVPSYAQLEQTIKSVS